MPTSLVDVWVVADALRIDTQTANRPADRSLVHSIGVKWTARRHCLAGLPTHQREIEADGSSVDDLVLHARLCSERESRVVGAVGT